MDGVKNLKITKVIGGTDEDLFFGFDDVQVIGGGSNEDLVSGGKGNDTLTGGAGKDTLSGGAGADTLTGGAKDDDLFGKAGGDSLFGGTGEDFLSGGEGADTLKVEQNDDTLWGGAGADRLEGDAGSDVLEGGADADTLIGGTGGDELIGGAGADSLEGGAGGDTLEGGAGDDILKGGGGNDTYVFADGWGQDTLEEGAKSGGDKDKLNFSQVTRNLTFTRTNVGWTITSEDGSRVSASLNVEAFVGGKGRNTYNDIAEDFTGEIRLDDANSDSGTLDLSSVTVPVLFEVKGAGEVKATVTNTDKTKRTFTATGVENLRGGTGENTFKFGENGSIGGTITAPSVATNILDYSEFSTIPAIVNLGDEQIIGNVILEKEQVGVPPIREVRKLTTDGLEGTFKLKLNAQTTELLQIDGLDASKIEKALEALSNVNFVDVTGTGTQAAPFVITFNDPFHSIAELELAETNLLKQAEIQASTPAANVRQVIEHDATEGTFKLKVKTKNAVNFTTSKTTADIPFDATAAKVELELEKLSNVENVIVTKDDATNEWTFLFITPNERIEKIEVVATESKTFGPDIATLRKFDATAIGANATFVSDSGDTREFTITRGNAAFGTFTLEFEKGGDARTTADIDFRASNSEVKAKILSLFSGSGPPITNIELSGSSASNPTNIGGPWTLKFDDSSHGWGVTLAGANLRAGVPGTVESTPASRVRLISHGGVEGQFILKNTTGGGTEKLLPHNASAAQIKTALNALSINDIEVTGLGTTGNPWAS